VIAFYNDTIPPATQPVCHYMSNDLDRTSNSALIEWYDVTAVLNGNPAGSPIRQDMFTLGAGSALQSLPPGCACCVGYRTDYGGTPEFAPGSRPRARLRGRFYVGPLTIGANTASGGLLQPGLIDSLGFSFQHMARTQNTGAANQFRLVQWSRKAAAVHPITNYFVDEACTYQRRRADDTANRVHDWLPV
jgi:hypothetical protein